MKKRNRDIELLHELGTLRFIKRSWIQFLRSDVASISEHMFRMAWIALIIAKHEKVQDTGKIVKMVLVHDITESRTGDPHYVARQYVKLDEELAISDMLSETVVESELKEIWHEYEQRKSIESKIVKDADNLDVDMELRDLATRDPKLYSDWRATRQAVYTNLYTKTAKRLWKEIHDSNPHDWHIKGRNRLVAGDWKNVKKMGTQNKKR